MAKLIDFVHLKKKKDESLYTQVKPIKKLTAEQMSSSANKKRNEQ